VVKILLRKEEKAAEGKIKKQGKRTEEEGKTRRGILEPK